MRKISFVANVFFVAIIVFMSCNKTDIVPATESKNLNLEKTGSSMQTKREPCPGCYDYTATGFQGIRAETAKMMSTNYKLINQPLLAIDGNIPDATSIWFSLESLKNYIWKIEQAACKAGCDNALRLGMRVYYGRYPESMTNELANLDPAFAQHHTLFMIPTFQDTNNSTVHWDFDPWHWGSDPCKPTTMTQWFAISPRPFGEQNSLIFSIDEDQYFMNNNGTLSSALNHGDLIPPYPSIGSAY